MRVYVVDYLKEDPGSGRLFNRAFWVHDVPRVMPGCRLLGHRPVVDGTVGFRPEDPGGRWVVCDRCGVRPEPQGRLDPAVWSIGERYAGLWLEGAPPEMPTPEPMTPAEAKEEALARGAEPEWALPGPWPAAPTGTLGGQLIVGKPYSVGATVKVGNAGSEHILAADIRLPLLGALYLHTEEHGRWLQRRLNSVGYESRVVEVCVSLGRLYWRLWTSPDSHSVATPRWRDSSTLIDPVERILGPKRWQYEKEDWSVPAWVQMPEGDRYQVRLRLGRQSLAREKNGRRRRAIEEGWAVEWTCEAGIPVRSKSWKGDECSSVPVSDEAVEEDRWVAEACDAIVRQCSGWRMDHQWRPPEPDAADGLAGEGS